MQALLLNVSFGAAFLATVLYSAGLFFKKNILTILAKVSIASVIVGLTWYIALRWQIAQRPPLSDMFESLIVFAWAIAIAVIFIDLKYKIGSITTLGALMSLLTLGYASLLDKEIIPLLPALKSNWLTIHVLTCFVGYAALTLSFVAGLVLLCKKPGREKAKFDSGVLDKIGYDMISFGFLFLTLGIITGSVWANSAWGTYWSWDPKETWSLITWFIYAIYLHVRMQRGWKGRRAAWLAVLGYLAVLFTYFGVNYLLSGLHSYA